MSSSNSNPQNSILFNNNITNTSSSYSNNSHTTMMNTSSSSSNNVNSNPPITNHNNNNKNPKSVVAKSKARKKETPPDKRRVRTGCLTCRSKHKKCDEVKPICNFCSTKGLRCVWPEKVRNEYSKANSDSGVQLISPLSLASQSGPLAPESAIPNFSLDQQQQQHLPQSAGLPPFQQQQQQISGVNVNPAQQFSGLLNKQLNSSSLSHSTSANLNPLINNNNSSVNAASSIENLLAFNYMFPNMQ
ncbi:unnamed protein product [Ambrosiozyma monospora]|uniref:Unnamed protein product n=1 Tax=Ambrosiozyma monospora TaxID=43982 RepID=A0A9W6T4K6_AMBMO|nr:unnamed protein product [Ambrosiozyma monospora]